MSKKDSIKKKENKKTLGTQLLESYDHYVKNTGDFTVGEIVDEMGSKEIMPEIWRQIREREGSESWKETFFIVVWFRKHQIINRVTECFVHSRHTRPRPEPGLTLWSYNPKEKKLKLEWVLPRKEAFMTFLSKEYYFDPFLIECIKRYKEGILF